MRLKKGYILHNAGGEYLMVATGKAAREFNGLVRNNETAQFLLSKLQSDVTEEQLTDALLEAYQVNRETAARDVHRLVERLTDEGFLDA